MDSTKHLPILLLILAYVTASPRVRRIIPASSSMTPTPSQIKWYESTPDYPQEDAERLLAKLKKRNITRFLLSTEKLEDINKTEPAEGDTNYHGLCWSVKKRVYPVAVEIDGTKFFILNPKREQYIDTEICNSTSTNLSESDAGYEDKVCKYVEFADFPVQAKCFQETITIKIFVMSNDRFRKLIFKPIPINSCCSCLIVT